MSHSNLKPIHVYGKGGPNPTKIPLVLELIGVPYEIEEVPFTDVKKPYYLAINPNGRLPAIRDPNNGDLVLWESGAILEYLVERYDTERRISFEPGSADAQHARQWLYYQATGQGPYYGQAIWFKVYHRERLPSAVERYVNEAKRVTGVLEGWLQKQKDEGKGGADGPWLVGGKLSFADVAFIPWQEMILLRASKEEFDTDDFPLVKDWVERMRSRPAIKKVFDPVMAQLKAAA